MHGAAAQGVRRQHFVLYNLARALGQWQKLPVRADPDEEARQEAQPSDLQRNGGVRGRKAVVFVAFHLIAMPVFL